MTRQERERRRKELAAAGDWQGVYCADWLGEIQHLRSVGQSDKQIVEFLEERLTARVRPAKKLADMPEC